MDSNVLPLLALKVKWLSSVLQWRFLFIFYRMKKITNHDPPVLMFKKRIVLVGWLKGGGISGTVGELRLGSQELTL